MSDTAAAIKGKGLEHTGVTEDYASQMFERVGTHYVGVVDLVVDDRQGPNRDGKRKVYLAIDSIELAPNEDVAEHIRQLLRAAHYERGLAVNGGDQLPLEGADNEPTVEQVRAAGRAHEPDPEAHELALAEKESAEDAADQAADPSMDAVNAAADHDMAALQAEQTAEDPWDEGAPALSVASPFDLPDPDPLPAA